MVVSRIDGYCCFIGVLLSQFKFDVCLLVLRPRRFSDPRNPGVMNQLLVIDLQKNLMSVECGPGGGRIRVRHHALCVEAAWSDVFNLCLYGSIDVFTYSIIIRGYIGLSIFLLILFLL